MRDSPVRESVRLREFDDVAVWIGVSRGAAPGLGLGSVQDLSTRSDGAVMSDVEVGDSKRDLGTSAGRSVLRLVEGEVNERTIGP